MPIIFVGVLPECLYLFVGVLPECLYLFALWESYILPSLVLKSRRFTPNTYPGVLPETKIVTLGVLPKCLFWFCGSYILDLYIWSIPLPVSVFNSSGSTPTSTIPLLWEYSQNNGIVPLGVLPDLLKTDTGT